MFAFYSRMLERHPILTKCITNGLIMSIGDAVCQTVIEKRQFNLQRNMNFFCINFFVAAPIFHLWYCKVLPRIRLALFPGVSKPKNVLYSMLFDQLLFTPLLYTAFYPTFQMVCDRDVCSFGKGVQVCRQKLWETIYNSWKIWPLASTINFWFVPIKHQVLFVSCVGLFWNMCVSYIASK